MTDGVRIMDEKLLDKQFLTFRMDEDYAINVGHVLEVLEYSKITKLPNTPDFIAGVINNRGMVVPVIYLRRKFGLENNNIDKDTCFIIIEIRTDDGPVNIGLQVDSVQEVVTFEEDQIEPAPKIGLSLDISFLQGIGKIEERFIIILDIEKILTAEELVLIKENNNDTEEAKNGKTSKKEKVGSIKK